MKAFANVGSMSSHASTQIAITAKIGTLSARATLLQSWCPGTARSREKANSMRDADVTEALPQKSCPTQAMKRRNSAHVALIEVSQMYGTAKPTASSVPCTSGIANVIATSSMKPKATETTTAETMPQAAARDACRVSSLMCADASHALIVYCDMRRPIPNTNQKARLEKLFPENPELLIVSLKTKPTD
jgi:Mrp family chromosome partitioning ATPase